MWRWRSSPPRPDTLENYDDWREFNRKAREDAERRAAEGLSGPVSQQRGAATKRPDGSVIHPVVLVPGICGSALWAHPGSAKPWRAWVVLEHSDQEFRHLLGRFDPSSGIFLPLRPDQPTASSDDRLSRPSWIPGFGRTSGPSPTEAPKIVAGVPGDDTGLQGVEVLDPDMLLPVEAVRYYRLMSLHLQQLGYVPGVTLWGAPYDFRQSNRAHATLDSLEARLERAFEAGGRVPVDIVSHSMGGLVVKSLLALRPQVFERLVRKWVTIGTPFQGAAGYVSDALMTGVQFAAGWEEHFFVQRETFRLLAAQSPALFELMPAPSARAARRCQECRARGCTGACVTGEHEEQTARPQKDSSLTPTVSVWVKPNSHLHRVALAAGAVSSQDDAPPAPLACPCCASAAKAPARAMSYKEAVTRGSGAEAPAPETTAASHVVSARETGVVATVANTAGARASRKHRCEVHVSWDNKMPRRGVSLGVSVSKEDVDVDVRVGRLDAEVDVARGPLGGDSEGAEGAKGAEGPEEDEGVNKEERAVRVTFGLWDGEGGERASFFKLLAARMEADRVDVPGVPGATASLPLQEAVVAWARETEAILREAELPEGCQFLNIAGFGHPTPLSVEYGSQDAPIGAAGDLSGLEGRFSECEGDGVVPLASAYGDGLKAAGRLTMKGTHRGLLEDPDVMRVVSDWLVCDGV